MIEYKSYPVIDENDLYIGSKFPLNKDKSGNYLMPGGCIDLDIPLIPEGYVAVLNENKNGWIFKTDNSGEYFDIDEKRKVNIDYPLTTIPENYIKQELSEFESYNKTTETIEFDLAKYKEHKIKELSNKCLSERIKILPDHKILNILSGATEGYPEYLTAANIAIFIEVYKTIYHTNESLINLETDVSEIDDIIDSLVFPTEQEILNMII